MSSDPAPRDAHARGRTPPPPPSSLAAHAPRRAAPATGCLPWTGPGLAESAYMVPLGAAHAAEALAASGTEATANASPAPLLDAVAADLAARLDHGLGFALLRGLPDTSDGVGLLRRLARGLGGAALGEGEAAPEAADVLLLRPPRATEAVLLSAAAAHDALVAADRAALAALHAGPAPLFACAPAVPFAARPGRATGRAGALDALAPALALRLSLRAGDVLALNPLLVWYDLPAADPVPTATAARLALRTDPSRLDAFAAPVAAAAA